MEMNYSERLTSTLKILEESIEKNKNSTSISLFNKENNIQDPSSSIIQKLIYGNEGQKHNGHENFKDQILKSKMHEEAKELALNELQNTNSKMGGEFSQVGINYIKTLLSLPWEIYSEEQNLISKTSQILERDHYGLEKVKKRILEYISVRKISNQSPTILCFNGPPGVGKTSLAKSISESLGRVFMRLSLGGVRDESNIRGHRRTYIGSMPGNIIQTIKKAKTSNPLILLDEIDKLGQENYKGDIESSLLEVLDPEQNSKFQDHYLGTYYDLSKVFFLCTSNNIEKISAPLRDRLEIINLSGYSLKEKIEIAKNYLIPKQLKQTGLGTLIEKYEVNFSDNILEYIVENYTFESGVRGLEKKISGICRYVVKEILEAKEKNKDLNFSEFNLNENLIEKILGRIKSKLDIKERTGIPGIAIGMAYTLNGGTVTLIESSKSFSDKSSLKITGNIKEIMQESVYTSISWIKANLHYIQKDFDFSKYEFHVHVPEAAVPKDGPSAGITICCSLVSLITGISLRNDTAMTGEISLTGFVLPVGGIKEKILGVHKFGINRFILSIRNKKDYEEAFENDELFKSLTVIFVSNILEVFVHAFPTGTFNKKSGFSFVSKF